MAIKVGINGFGRIGRMAFRAIAKDFPGIEVVGINDLLEPDYLAYMLRYDSVHGNFKGDIAVEGSNLIVNGKKIRLTAEKDPANLKWSEIGADIVIECTGFFLTKETCQKHIDAGAKKVVQSAPSKDDTADVRLWRESQEVCRREDRFRRFLHHQLPGSRWPRCCTTNGASSAA
jgi:glyceraldehyde 3-phosphate dehydrogenase